VLYSDCAAYRSAPTAFPRSRVRRFALAPPQLSPEHFVNRSSPAAACCVPRTIAKFQLRGMSTALPEHTVLLMPALSPTMTQGNIASWLKKIGDEISPGDAIAELETDKATLGFEAVESGFLACILVPVGSKDVQVGTPVAVIVEDLASVAASSTYKHGAAPAAPAAPKAAAAPAPPAATAPPPKAAAPALCPSPSRVVIWAHIRLPLAKNIAAAAGSVHRAPRAPALAAAWLLLM